MAYLLFQYLTFQLCIVAMVHGQHAPAITYITPTQIHDIGDRLDLVCAVEYAQEYPVLWVKYESLDDAESLPLSYNSNLIIKDIRFSIRFDAQLSAYTLSIKDIQETDAGWYQCLVNKSVNDKITAEVELQIRKPPIFSTNTTCSLLTAEGQSAQLECFASGVPPPKVYWRRENNAEFTTGESIYRGNILKISSIRKEDRGTYYCVAENGVGKNVRRLIDLQVESAPVIIDLKLTQTQDNNVYLVCNVNAYPLPAIFWLKDEVQLTSDHHYRISNFASTDDFIVSTLQETMIEKSLYGNYTCKAQNKLGIAQSQLELFGNPGVRPIVREKQRDEIHG